MNITLIPMCMRVMHVYALENVYIKSNYFFKKKGIRIRTAWMNRMVKENEMRKDLLDPCGGVNSVARRMTGKVEAGQRGG